MHTTSPGPTVIVSAAVVIQDGRVLLTQRPAGSHLSGLWEFPGGKVDAGEDPERAVVRECREECLIDVEVEDILDVTFHRYPQKQVLLLFYRCRLIAGEVAHVGVADHVWCAGADLDRYELPPADQRVVAKIRRLLAAAVDAGVSR